MRRRRDSGEAAGARRRRGRNPVAVGLIALVAIGVGTVLGFTRDIPFVNEPYEIRAAFRDSTGIAAGSPVRIAGVEVGEVTDVRHTKPGARSATVTMAIRDDGRPIKRDAEAKIRPRIFLEGNFFVDLRPGTPSAKELAEGGTIPADRTANPVQLDEVLKVLQADARDDLRRVLVELGTTQREGGGRAFNASLDEQSAAYRATAIVSEALLGEHPTDLGDWIRDGGVVAGALDQDPRALRDLVTTFDRTVGALADREADLRAAVDELPRTERAALPALEALNAAFPDVRRLARQARPGVRSTGPASRAMLPLVRELRGVMGPEELRGLAADLRAATPPLARATAASVPLLDEVRAMSSCASRVLLPFGDSRVGDPVFEATGPVAKEFPKSLVGLAGESRSFDANGQWFKVLGTGGAETFDLGNGMFGTSGSPFLGVNPQPVRTRPPLRPEVACETQEAPDLRSTPGGPPASRRANLDAPAVRERVDKARGVAIDLLQRSLRRSGSDLEVRDEDATLGDVRALSRKLGLESQLERLRRAREEGKAP